MGLVYKVAVRQQPHQQLRQVLKTRASSWSALLCAHCVARVFSQGSPQNSMQPSDPESACDTRCTCPAINQSLTGHHSHSYTYCTRTYGTVCRQSNYCYGTTATGRPVPCYPPSPPNQMILYSLPRQVTHCCNTRSTRLHPQSNPQILSICQLSMVCRKLPQQLPVVTTLLSTRSRLAVLPLD